MWGKVRQMRGVVLGLGAHRLRTDADVNKSNVRDVQPEQRISRPI